MHVHACLLALHTGKPVKMVYNREESFFGHVHRHPATHALRARRRPATASWSTSGPRSSSTAAPTPPAPRPWSATPARMGIGPYVVPNVHVDAYGVYTNNPPCGAMRGFGVGAGRVRLRGADGQAGRPSSAWTRSSCAAATP